jgi:hypothetical protein
MRTWLQDYCTPPDHSDAVRTSRMYPAPFLLIRLIGGRPVSGIRASRFSFQEFEIMTAVGGRGGNLWRVIGWGGAAALLSLPWIGMQVSDEVNWTATDFITMGAMLGVAGLAIEVLVRMNGNLAYRLGAVLAVATAFLLVWVNLAVGFLGSEKNASNLVFLAVLSVALIGATVARSHAAGMARVMVMTAAVQVLIGLVAIPAGWASPGSEGLYEVAMGTTLFTALWLAAAYLFRRAAGASGEGRAAA